MRRATAGLRASILRAGYAQRRGAILTPAGRRLVFVTVGVVLGLVALEVFLR